MARRAAVVVGVLALLFAAGCPGSGRPPRARPTPPPKPKPAQPPALPHAWPPTKGQPFPALELLDIHGRSVQLSSLAGKVLIVEPVGLSCAGCQAFSGGGKAGGFRGVEPQQGLPSIEDILASRGIDPAHPDLVVVQLIFYDMTAAAAPTVADARAWAEHFGLDRRPNTFVLVGDERYISQETYSIIPGFYVVDRELKIVGDLTSPNPPDDYPTVMAALAALLEPVDDGPPFVPPTDPAAVYPELAELATRNACRADLVAGRFDALEERLAALKAAGRRQGDFALLLDLAIDRLPFELDPQVFADALDAWCAAKDGSSLARLARGHFLIRHAWAARGSGFADTVTDDGWRLFFERLQRARADLERAAELDPTLAPARARLITVAMGLQLDEGVARAYFDAAVAADPLYHEAYTRRLKAIMPKWGGEPGAMWALVEEVLTAHPEEPALQLLAIEAHLEQGHMTRGAHLRDPEVRRGLLAAQEAVTRAYPRSEAAWDMALTLGQWLKDPALTRAALLGAAEGGHPTPQLQAAGQLMTGANGFRRDRPKAAELALRAALMERPQGMILVGHMLESGLGIAKDVAAGVAWYRRAAEVGDGNGMLLYAEALALGKLGAVDADGAREWLQRALASGDRDVVAEAREHLARLGGGR